MLRQGIVIVLDSAGVGHAPDAAAYGDVGANTLGHLLQTTGVHLPTFDRLGLGAALALAAGGDPDTLPESSAVGVLTEVSAGKDTTTGHWEIAGVRLPEPFAVFEQFPEPLVAAIEAEAGVRFLGNQPASGTAILAELGGHSFRSGQPILYTSADSVFQIAAHETAFGLARLLDLCAIARRHCDAWSIGRVIARPFEGEPGNFRRTANRRDFAMKPPRTVLNALNEAGVPVTAVGKISDIFAGSGITTSHPTHSNAEGMEITASLIAEARPGLVFVNLVDFDMLFGHRRDPVGYARALAEFDHWLAGQLPNFADGDRFLLITADHGNDPTWTGTDHTRERVPLWILDGVTAGSLGVIEGLDFIAHYVATAWGLEAFRRTSSQHLPCNPRASGWI